MTNDKSHTFFFLNSRPEIAEDGAKTFLKVNTNTVYVTKVFDARLFFLKHLWDYGLCAPSGLRLCMYSAIQI